MSRPVDLVVVGAGIVGLAHALAAARRGLRVAVVERDLRACAASLQNFGFVTVTGQAEGDTRRRAMRSREIWLEACGHAGIGILQRGALVVAQRAEARDVLGAYAASGPGEGCELLEADEVRRRWPMLPPGAAGALWSPHELRVDPREAMPRLAAWLAQAHGVQFHWGAAATRIEANGVRHAEGKVEAGAVVVAPGVALRALAPGLARTAGLRACRLQMLRTAPAAAGFRLDAVLMSDLSLVRYEGFASQAPAAKLRARLEAEAGAALAQGVHLIVAQDADGSLVVGDSHAYGEALEPFSSDAVDALILAELDAVLGLRRPEIAERWLGVYAVAEIMPVLRDSPSERVRTVVVTSGTGMSTAFALAEETVAELFT